MFPLIVLATLTAFSSNVDPKTICESARAASAGDDQPTAFSGCIRDEQQARDELKRSWARYSVASRATCAEPQGEMMSYVEVLTCLQMQNGAKFGTEKQ
jgi:hypothetical protein